MANSILTLAWTRLTLRAMGDGPYGLFVSFLSIPTLGGLGDFGIAGALAIRTGQAVARGQEESLRRLIAGARGLMLMVGGALAGVLLALSPWLPGWLGFHQMAGAGSLWLLFATGSLSLFVYLFTGYFNALNGGYGTVTWPILPAFVLTQVGLGVQWMLARSGSPLWGINLGLLAVSLCGVVVAWRLLRLSHPWLGALRPIAFDRESWRDLAGTSGWAYLYSIGNAIYIHTDRLLINAAFGAALIPKYLLNAKLCELSLIIISTGAAVSLPKINQWLASPDPAVFQKAAGEIQRLNIFQTLLACMAAIFYLGVNDLFISRWLGPGYIAPYAWQIAFALNLAISAAGNAGVQIAGACGKTGLRFAGVTIGLTALLNLSLSCVSVKLGSIAGISFATVLAQSILTLVLSWRVCSFAGIVFKQWLLRSWCYPMLAIALACALRACLPPQTWLNTVLLIAGDLAIMAVLAWLIGVKPSLLRHEWEILLAMVGKGKKIAV